MKLEGKVAVITGASRGIGLAIAEAFEREGAKLILTAKKNLDSLGRFKNAKTIPLDLSSNQSISLFLEEAVKVFGKIDILVNNAGIFKQTDFEAISAQELDDFLDVDFKGPFLLTQKIFIQMKKQKYGKIINIASGAGKMGSSKAIHYACAKAALISLTKSLARIGGQYNISVNAVAPGYIETDMIKDILLEKKAMIEGSIPLGRIGQDRNVAGPVLFFASADSDYITGQTLCVDGGHCMI
ncbi:MAG: SDR family oxidoreductase [Candidatus Omnitrophota bacterium]|nr:MAG: SDR family oxidoreductase [Candidatus Omnitrophota bacterium]